MDYEDYLRILFTFTSKEKSVMRTMDMIELNIRQIEGKERFRFDACIDAISMSFLIKKAGKYKLAGRQGLYLRYVKGRQRL